MGPIEFSDVDWFCEGNLVTATGAIAGVPFNAKATSGSVVASVSNVTEATGPNHIDNPDNWADGKLPESKEC